MESGRVQWMPQATANRNKTPAGELDPPPVPRVSPQRGFVLDSARRRITYLATGNSVLFVCHPALNPTLLVMSGGCRWRAIVGRNRLCTTGRNHITDGAEQLPSQSWDRTGEWRRLGYSRGNAWRWRRVDQIGVGRSPRCERSRVDRTRISSSIIARIRSSIWWPCMKRWIRGNLGIFGGIQMSNSDHARIIGSSLVSGASPNSIANATLRVSGGEG